MVQITEPTRQTVYDILDGSNTIREYEILLARYVLSEYSGNADGDTIFSLAMSNSPDPKTFSLQHGCLST